MSFIRGKAPFEAIPGSQRCTAMSKQARRQCRQLAAPGSDKCRFHGGRSLRGRQHPGYRHGARSQRGIAELRHVNRLGLAMQMLEKAETEREKRAADDFAWWVLASEPTGE